MQLYRRLATLTLTMSDITLGTPRWTIMMMLTALIRIIPIVLQGISSGFPNTWIDIKDSRWGTTNGLVRESTGFFEHFIEASGT